MLQSNTRPTANQKDKCGAEVHKVQMTAFHKIITNQPSRQSMPNAPPKTRMTTNSTTRQPIPPECVSQNSLRLSNIIFFLSFLYCIYIILYFYSFVKRFYEKNRKTSKIFSGGNALPLFHSFRLRSSSSKRILFSTARVPLGVP